MPKKSTPKKNSVKKTTSVKKRDSSNINEKLLENFVSLQKVMTNMAKRFDNLSDHIARLLELFEVSAKVLAEKDYKKDKSTSEEKQIKKHLENLLAQNKILARGLTIINEKMLEHSDSEIPAQYSTQRNPPKQEPYYEREHKESGNPTQEEYRKSISNVDQPPQSKSPFKKLPSHN